MQQHRLVGMEGRVEPEPALGGKVGFHDHVGDQEVVLEDLALALKAELITDLAVGTVGHQQVVAGQAIVAVFRADQHLAALGAAVDLGHLVLPAQVDPLGELVGTIDQILLEVVLLQVDEGRHAVALFRQQVEVVDFPLLEEHPAVLPGHALLDHRLATAQAIEDLQGTLGEADGS
ncbi:hypothetical protein Q427_23380 [Halomonas sp. BC04]|nr:hypothetical protein Q427_23380 [Halomonas sp. BC04]